MTLIDTHTHLYGEEFAEDLPEVVARAQAAGVAKVFLPNIDMASIEPMLTLCHQYPTFASPMLGLHPTEVRADYVEVLHKMKALLVPGHPYVGIGEVGLDFYWDKTYAREQTDVLDTQVQWALEQHLPLMLHVRSAYREVMEVLAPYVHEEGLRGVFHSFGGTADEAEELLRLDGFVLGINGIVSFKKSTLPDVLADVVPLRRIVLETDSPYLAPVPHRGQRNESAFVADVLRKVADIYKVSEEEAAQQTCANALRVFDRVKMENYAPK